MLVSINAVAPAIPSDPYVPLSLAQSIPAGQTQRVAVVVKKPDGTARDLTNCQILLTVSDSEGNVVVAHQATITDVVNGVAYIDFVVGDTDGKAGSYTYDVWLTDAAVDPNNHYQLVAVSAFTVTGVRGTTTQAVTVAPSQVPLALGPQGPQGVAGAAGPAGPGAIPLAHVAAVRSFAVPSASPASLSTTGHWTDGDGGGADYYWDAASTLTDDGGLVLKPSALTGAQPGRWRAKIKKGRIDPKVYGAIGDDTMHPLSERFATLADAQAVYPHATALTDTIDWAAWQAAINACRTTFIGVTRNALGGTLTPSSGVYLFNQPLNMTATLGLTIRGNGHGAVGTGSGSNGSVALMYTEGDGRRFIDARSVNACTLAGLSIMNGPSYTGRLVDADHFNGADTSTLTLRDCTLSAGLPTNPGSGAYALLHLGNAISSRVENCVFGIAQRAIKFRENDGSYSNAHTISGCNFVYHKYSLVNAGESVKINDCIFEGSSGHLYAAYYDEYTDVVVTPACTFTFDAAAQTITRSSGSWITDGWADGMTPTAFCATGLQSNVHVLNPVAAGGVTATVLTLTTATPTLNIADEVRASDCLLYAEATTPQVKAPTSNATLGCQITFAGSTIARDTGSWRDDFAYIGMGLNITGSASNNVVAAPIVGISADGKTLDFGADSLVFAGNTITRTDGKDFALDGWVNGMPLTVGNTVSNNGTYGAVTVAVNVLTVAGAAFVAETSATADAYSLLETKFQARTLASVGQTFVAESMTAGRIYQTFGGGPIEFKGVWAGDEFLPTTWLQFGQGSSVKLAGACAFVGGLRVAEFRQSCNGLDVDASVHMVVEQEPFKFSSASGVKIDCGSFLGSGDVYTVPDEADLSQINITGHSEGRVDLSLRRYAIKSATPMTFTNGTAAVDYTTLAILINQGVHGLGLGAFGAGALVQSNGDLYIQWYGGHTKLNFDGFGYVDIGYPYHDPSWDPTSLVRVNGSYAKAIDTYAVDTALVYTDGDVLVDATSNAVTMTLPDATTCKGREIVFQRIDGGANAATIASTAGQFIGSGAATTYALAALDATVKLKSDGTRWRVMYSH